MRFRGVAWLSAVVLVACSDDASPNEGGTTGGTAQTGDTSSSSDGGSSSMPSTSMADSSGSSSTGEPDNLEPLPPLESIVLTTEVRRAPLHAVSPEPMNDPRIPAQLDQMIGDGYGEEEEIEGEPIVDVTLDASEPPAPGAGATRLTRFVHLADTQVPDDESPTRLMAFDTPGATSGAFRPQEAYACNITNAAVRTVNAAHAADPVDLVVLGGDNADSAQTNEVAWFLGILDGASRVECDSAVDDDPVPGEGNDPKDPFEPVGLDVPWLWVMGNHDVLVQGNFVIAGREDNALGEDVDGATRDWSLPGGPETMDLVPADPARALLDGATLLEMVRTSGDGHGVDEATVASGKANYAFDVPDTDVRFIIIDTAGQTGGAEGLIRGIEVDDFLQPALDAAQEDGKWVFLASHHASGSLSDGGGLGGSQQPDAITTLEFQALLGDYDNVIAHLCGHSHVHQVTAIEPVGGHAYWEVITSAIADHPHQMRIFELEDQDNGFLTLTSVALDVALDDDTLAAQGRLRSITDVTSGWQITGEGVPEDRNVRLWLPLP